MGYGRTEVFGSSRGIHLKGFICIIWEVHLEQGSNEGVAAIKEITRINKPSDFSTYKCTLITFIKSTGSLTLWKICVVLWWMASTSTWWGGYLRCPCFRVFCSLCRESWAMGCLLVRKNWDSSWRKGCKSYFQTGNNSYSIYWYNI